MLVCYLLIALSVSIKPIQFLVHIILFFYELYAMLKHKEFHYVVATFLLLIASSSLIQYHDINNNQLVLLYFVGFIAVLIYGYKYVFKNSFNKIDLTFKKIKIPQTESFLACKYICGLPFKHLGNAIITKDDNNVYLKIESDEMDNIYDMTISESQILKFESVERPYVLTKDNKKEGRKEKKEIIKSKNQKYKNDVKVIMSYNLTIKLKNGTVIQLITFNDPEKFFKD